MKVPLEKQIEKLIFDEKFFREDDIASHLRLPNNRTLRRAVWQAIEHCRDRGRLFKVDPACRGLYRVTNDPADWMAFARARERKARSQLGRGAEALETAAHVADSKARPSIERARERYGAATVRALVADSVTAPAPTAPPRDAVPRGDRT